MPITVEQIKKLAPQAEVYNLEKGIDVTYLIVLDANYIGQSGVQGLVKVIDGADIPAAIVVLTGGSAGIDLYKLGE